MQLDRFDVGVPGHGGHRALCHIATACSHGENRHRERMACCKPLDLRALLQYRLIEATCSAPCIWAGVCANKLVQVGFADRKRDEAERRKGNLFQELTFAPGKQHLGNIWSGEHPDMPGASLIDVG